MGADDRFPDRVASPRFCERRFAHLPVVVSCLKDRKRRYQAAMAGLPPSQPDRQLRRVFQLTTSRFTRKTRIEHAVRLPATIILPVTGIALACGYGGQTALAWRFRAMVGMPSAACRDHLKRHG